MGECSSILENLLLLLFISFKLDPPQKKTSPKSDVLMVSELMNGSLNSVNRAIAISDLRSLLQSLMKYSIQLSSHERFDYLQELGGLAGCLLIFSPVEESFGILISIIKRLLPRLWSVQHSWNVIKRLSRAFEGFLEVYDLQVFQHLVSLLYPPFFFALLFLEGG